MSDHDDIDDLSPEELAEAQALASSVDDLVAGKAMPSVGEVEQKELLRTSAMIRAAHHEVSLDADRKASLIEEAMAAGLPGAGKGDDFAKVHSLDAARAKRNRSVSVALTGLIAVAVIALLWFRTPSPSEKGESESTQTPVATLQELPTNQQSRTSDELIGRIDPQQSGMTSNRLDQIYGDRMGGYRALHYGRLAGKQ
jgi:hypothetical protein